MKLLLTLKTQKRGHFKRLMLLCMLSLPLMVQAQNQKVSFSQKQITLRAAFEEIEKQTNLTVAYNESGVDVNKIISVDIKDKPVSQVLNDILQGTKVTWKLEGKTIIIIPAPQTATQNNPSKLKTVTGTVIDETGESVIGASVVAKGTSLGTATDIDGNFSLNVPDNISTLVVKYIGYKEQEFTAGTNVQVKLTQDATALEEVVITVAYGTQKRNALTGAITSLGAKEIEQRPITSATSLLEGKMGIQVSSETGQPGSQPSVRIRGIGSITGNNDPLYVVDGFVFDGLITDINSADIAEVSVLKDASSAAIYGSRASNGVILITTKRGNTEKPHISLTMNQGIDQRNMPEYDRLGTNQWMEATWLGYRNSFMSLNGQDLTTANKSANDNLVPNLIKYNIYNQPNNALFDANGKLTGQIREGFRDDLDWFKAGTRNGHRQEYQIAGDGRVGTTSDYYFSAGYLDQQGYTPDAQFKRFSGRAKVNMAPTKWFKTGFNIAATDQEKSNMNAGDGGYTSLFSQARNMPPIYPVHQHYMTDMTDADGTEHKAGDYMIDPATGQYIYDNGNVNGRPQQPNRHTIWENELNTKTTTRKTLSGNIFGEITFLKDFKAKVSGSIDTYVDENEIYQNALIGDGFSGEGTGAFTDHRVKTYSFLEQLTWGKIINDHYSIDVLAAHENFSWNDVISSGGKKGEKLAGKPYMTNYTTMTDLEGYENNRRTESYLSRVQLNYDEKYYLDGSFRRDGSSRLYRKTRWGNFYSVGAAWNISKEDFMSDVKWINYAKLRANYGETGNDMSVGLYGWMGLYNTAEQNAMEPAYLKSQLESLNIKWEASTSFGLALDGRIFDRYNFSLEYFDKRARDLLFAVKMPQSAGATSNSAKWPTVTQNIGNSSNRGFELTLDAEIMRTKDFSWHAELSATALRNKVLTLPQEMKDNEFHGMVDGNRKFTEGHSIYEFWVYQYVGVDQMTGRSLYELDTDRYYVADRKPDDVGARTEISATDGSGDPTTVRINGVDYTYKTQYGKRDFSGDAIPKIMGSFSTGVDYKGIALSVLFTYAAGNKVMDAPYASLMGISGSLPTALHKDVLKSWTAAPEGMTADAPNRISKTATPVLDNHFSSDNNAASNRWLTNGSYLMFKNINLSYSLPKAWIQNLELTGVRLNVTVENLHLFSARKGLNSQMSFNGDITSSSSMPRVINFGVKVDF
jgi:TonB-linked SusC/RagA family outer membrane protein